jgi:hypothetical protein
MRIALNGHELKTAVLIPTRGRADHVLKTWSKKMPFMNDGDVWLGIEWGEKNDYAKVREMFPNVRAVYYTNTVGSVALAREQLRKKAMDFGTIQGNQFTPRNKGIYDWFVVTDDNATFTQESLHNLVKTSAAWYLEEKQHILIAGMHNTAPHFDRRLIEEKYNTLGFDSYPAVSMMFQVYPRALYWKYSYPTEAYGLDDRHLILWMIAHQGLHRNQFRVAMSAPFTKSRYQEGGQGSIEERAEKNGLAIAKLATDFPKFVGMAGTLKLPWQMIFKASLGDFNMDRLAGGAMRKEEELFAQPRSTSASVKIRRRK